MATEVLYYPFMKPSEHWLRAALLFNDRVYTIVPTDLQGLDWLTPKTRRIVDRVSETAPAPPHGDDDCSLAQIDPHADAVYETSASTLTSEVVRYYESHRDAGAFEEVGVNRFLSLAGEKLPQDLRPWLERRDLYVQVAEDPDGGRIHPNVGNFFMNRLASIVSTGLEVPSATDSLRDFACNALHGIDRPQELEDDVQLLAWSLSVIVPEEIVSLDVDAYMEVRALYQDIAVDVTATMSDLVRHHRVDRADELDALVARLDRAQTTIEAGITRSLDERGKFEAGRRKRMWLGGLLEAVKALLSPVGIVERVVSEASRQPEIPPTPSQVVYSHLADRSLRVQQLAEPLRRQLGAVPG